VRGAKTLAAASSRPRSREEGGGREGPRSAPQMEPAAARKEWRAVPDAPLRSNGAEVSSSHPFFRAAAKPLPFPPPCSLARPVFFFGSCSGRLGAQEDGEVGGQGHL
jgi:hypothetical protein